jgi:hypothetical protein
MIDDITKPLEFLRITNMMSNKNRIILFLILLLLSCGEVQDSFYKTMDDAKRSGAVEKGWLPPIMPDSS